MYSKIKIKNSFALVTKDRRIFEIPWIKPASY